MCAKAGQVTLGEMKALLESCDQTLPVRFECGGCPGDYMSYRGYYDMIAVDHGDTCTVAEFLAKTTEAIGKEFTGYKGGEFIMTKHTPVWVAEYGQSGGIGIVGIERTADAVILKTADIEGKP
jgi:hypothetical protein